MKTFIISRSCLKYMENQVHRGPNQPSLTNISLSFFFLGHEQIVQTGPTRRLIRVSTVCLQNDSIKIEKSENTPNNP